MYKNTAGQYVYVRAHDTAIETPKTGDASNITATISKDGAAGVASNDLHPAEMHATNFPGIYRFDLTQAETNCDLFLLHAKSTTANIKCMPIVIYTVDNPTLVDAIYDEAYSGHTTAGTGGYAWGLIAGLASSLSSITTTLTAHTASLSSLVSSMASIGATIWAYTTRTLTVASGAAGSSISGSAIEIYRGDTLALAINGIGDISSRTNLWFTVKTSLSDADTAAIIQIDTTTGLKYINAGAAGTPANGSITVVSAPSGNIIINLDEVETAKLSPTTTSIYYDVQMKTATTIETMTSGAVTITADVTKATT